MSKKDTALKEIASLIETNNISIADIQAYLAKNLNTSDKQSIFTKLFSYLGGIFIFSGVCIYTGMMWDEFGSFSRVLITLGTGIICLIMALIAIRDERYKKAFTPIMLMAAFLQPLGLFTFLVEYIDSSNSPEIAVMLVFGVMTLQQSAIFHKHKQTSNLFYTVLFGYTATFAFLSFLNWDEDISILLLGLSGLSLAYGISKTPHRIISEFGYFISTVGVASGAFKLLENTFDLALIGVAAALVYASVCAQSRTFLFVSICVLLGYLGYYTGEYFANLTGWPIALIIMGAIFIGISSMGVKLGQKIKK